MPAAKHQPSPPAPTAAVPAAAAVAPTAWAAPPPRGRPSWSGLLRLSLVSVPVQAYPAVSSTSASPFHLLHAHCGRRLQYQKRCPEHGPVESEAIVRGYEDAPDHWLIVEPEELDRLRPARDKALILEQFVPLQDVAPTLFAGRSLYLVPDGPAAHHPYNVLVDAFQQAGRGALGRVVLSSQRHLVLVRPSSRLLIVDVLHYPAQVRSAASWEAGLPPSAATEAERALAGQLIALASGPVDWARYRDTQAEDLAALLASKRAQQPPPATSEEPVVLHLLDALQQSVAAARRATESVEPQARKPRGRRVTG